MDRKGFTLIELVMVLVLIGILAAIASPRLPNITGSHAGSFGDKLRADIRYAQDLAMTRNRRARLYVNGLGTAPAAGYAAVIDSSASGNCATFVPVVDPASSGGLIVVLNAGNYVGVTVTPATRCIEFDALGQPYDCSANLAVCSAVAGGAIITINANGVAAGAVNVTAQTGAVN